MSAQFHTLVLHTFPDLDGLMGADLIRRFPQIAEALGVCRDPGLKFVPSGPPRREDWLDARELTTDYIKDQGYLGVDSVGGLLDHHGKEHLTGGEMSTLDLLVHYARLDQMEAYRVLRPIITIFSENDRTGQDICHDHGFKQSRWPNTQRHLRNLVIGWNLRYPDNPERMVELFGTAMDGVFALAASRLQDVDDDEAAVRMTRALFLLPKILEGVALLGEEARERFETEANAAFDILEAEWGQAVQDYWSRGTQVRTVPVTKRENGETKGFMLPIAIGTSSSTRYGAVTRLGNVTKKRGYGRKSLPRPFGDKPYRSKAAITLQFYAPGYFLVSSTPGIMLDGVAKVVRAADLRKRDVKLTKTDEARLSEPGHQTFQDKRGKEVESMYFAGYRTAFGNRYRTNRRSPKTALSRQEIIDLVLEGLRTPA